MQIPPTALLLGASLLDISEKIIPFFDKYPLEGSKLNDYLAFKKGISIIKDNSHLTMEGLNEIRTIIAGMNPANRKFPEEESSKDV
jgi:hypothetical protein